MTTRTRLAAMVEEALPCHGCDHGMHPSLPKNHEHWCPYSLRPAILALVERVWDEAVKDSHFECLSSQETTEACDRILALALPKGEKTP
jgi:hypothetical protein